MKYINKMYNKIYKKRSGQGYCYYHYHHFLYITRLSGRSIYATEPRKPTRFQGDPAQV